MRTLLYGALAGLLAAAAVGWLLSNTDALELPDKALAVSIAAAVTSLGVWALGTVRSVRAALRPRDLEDDEEDSPSEQGPPPVDTGTDDETVRLESSRWLQTAKIPIALGDALAATGRGDFRKAADLFSDVLDAAPDNVDAHLARGRVYLDMGDYNRAMSDFVAAEDLAPDSPGPSEAFGELYFARKDYDRALAYFDAVLERTPENAMVRCRRGLCHQHRKSYDLALEDLVRAKEIDPDIPNLGSHISAVERKLKGEKVRAKRR